MTRMCIVCGVSFKLDRSAYRHVYLSHYVPSDISRYYVTKIDETVKVDDSGDDVEVEFVS
jgi:uncharacterized protein YnzC (UPF0291/DUF896 family)